MARTNQKCAAWVIDLLGIQPHDRVLKVGFGPGVGIELLARSVSGGYIAGVDPSEEMVEQATARNVKAIESGRVDLRYGSVESLPFEDNTFNKALAVNSMQVWPDAGWPARNATSYEAWWQNCAWFHPLFGAVEGRTA